MKKGVTITKETWKDKTKIVARENGKLLTHQTIQQSESLESYKRRYKATQSFNPNVKEIETFQTGVQRVISDKRVKRKKDTQIACTLTIRKKWAREPEQFQGFSNRNVDDETGKEQAYGMAVKKAVASGYIRYDDIAQTEKDITYWYVAYV